MLFFNFFFNHKIFLDKFNYFIIIVIESELWQVRLVGFIRGPKNPLIIYIFTIPSAFSLDATVQKIGLSFKKQFFPNFLLI